MNTLSEYYIKGKEDYDLTLFPIAVPKSEKDPKNATVLFVSDTHYGDWFDGPGGFSGAERHQRMIEFILENKDRYDCVIINGDMASHDGQVRGIAKLHGDPQKDRHWIRLLKEDCFDRLTEEGMPYFAIHASHDSLDADEFQDIFGYEHNYVVLAGTTAYICCDTYNGPRKDNGQTDMADIPEDFVREVKKLLLHGYVENAFVVCHYGIAELSNLKSLITEPKVRGTLCGHSHFNEVRELCKKPMLETGHFSRADVKLRTWGLEFKPFCPVSRSMPYVVDYYGNPHPDYSASGSPWQARVVSSGEGEKGTSIESYMVYPEQHYEACTIEGRSFPAFDQPYAEARPAFLGKDAPIDKSYFLLEV